MEYSKNKIKKTFSQLLKTTETKSGKKFRYYSLPNFDTSGYGGSVPISYMPFSLRIILESIIRNADEVKVLNEHIQALATWQPNADRTNEIPFVVTRVVLQDYTGVPLLADLAAMREAISKLGGNPSVIEPLVQVDLVIDHSVQTDHTRTKNALDLNMKIEFARNEERYKFLKWGSGTFEKFKIVPPGTGIIHQVNLEYLAKGVFSDADADKNLLYFPDSLVGTDSHTTMIGGLGILGWGVGGIEAEAAMLGQPIYMLMPDVMGFHLSGQLKEGVTTTDLVLTITEILRKEKVVGKIIEYFGSGARELSVPERATIANMAPDYGATTGFFAVDQKTLEYYLSTGRSKQTVELIESYYKAQDMFGIPEKNDIMYTKVISLDLSTVEACVAGPKRPQDRISLTKVKEVFRSLLTADIKDGGYGLTCIDENLYTTNNKINHINTNNNSNISISHATNKQLVKSYASQMTHGSIVIAAITSCTNTSNPSVLIAAGLVAKLAREKGLNVAPHIKTSLAPGSRAVSEYLANADLLRYLEELGFNVAAYGCTTCIGNVGPLDEVVDGVIQDKDLVVAAVLSGNRNFEARIHPSVKANFLASPPLVVAYAIAGHVNIDFSTDPIGYDLDANPVFLKDIWPSNELIAQHIKRAVNSDIFAYVYSDAELNKQVAWKALDSGGGNLYQWDQKSTYIANPPFFDQFIAENGKISNKVSSISGARILAILGDSITTDHISPAGNIKQSSPAGLFLQQHGVLPADFNSYGARRGHHEVMVRGTFSNSRIKNLMISGKDGGFTKHYPSGEIASIYDVAMRYIKENIQTIIFAGDEYGTGSSRDWAAKGTMLLGVKMVIAKSFERIHRSNLIGMGVLPCQFIRPEDFEALNLSGSEIIDVLGLEQIGVASKLTLLIKQTAPDDNTKIIKEQQLEVIARIDTEIEKEYYTHGGILLYILKSLEQNAKS